MRIRQYKGYKSTESVMATEDVAKKINSLYRQDNINIDNFQFSSKLESIVKNNVFKHLLYFHSLIQPIKEDAVDVHHILDISVANIKKRLGNGKTILSIHDLIPLLVSDGRFGSSGQSFVDNLAITSFFIKQQLKSIHDFDKVIVPSECTANDLQEVLHLNRNKIEIISPVLDKEYKVLPRSLVRKFRAKHALDPKSYWILTFNNGVKQNLRTSLQVLKELNAKSKRSIMMLCLGKANDDFEKMVKEYGVQQLVRQIEVTKPSEKAIVYNMAHCLLYPSVYSGFGMAVVESVACGTPVVTSDRGALQELMTDVIPHINPFDIRALTKEVYRSITRREVRDFFASESEELVKKFRSDVIAAQMVDVYQSLNS